MSAPNPNWTRWVFSSFATQLKTATSPFPLFIEGEDRRTDEQTAYAELRIDGPFMKEYAQGYWELIVEISVLVVGYINDTDLWLQQRNCGIVAAAFTDVPFKEYGDTDPPVYIECFSIYTDGRDRINISHFGKINEDSQMVQSSVDAKYRLTLQV